MHAHVFIPGEIIAEALSFAKTKEKKKNELSLISWHSAAEELLIRELPALLKQIPDKREE